MLSTKKGKEAYVEPVVEGGGYRFTVKVGQPRNAEAVKNGTKLARGASFKCLMSGTPIIGDYIKSQGKDGRIGARLMAIVVGGMQERVYLSPTIEHERIAKVADPSWAPDQEIAYDPNSGATFCVLYGLTKFCDLFTFRQLVALTTFCDLLYDARERLRNDSVIAGLSRDPKPLSNGGAGAIAYAEAVGLYLGFAISKQADLGNSLCGWEPIAQCPRHLFGRQAIPMIWDYAEGNPLGDSSGAWNVFVDGIARAFSKAFETVTSKISGSSQQADAGKQTISRDKIVSTDPPYYDNIGYADLSDFFYVWLRRSLRPVYPDLFSTLSVPKFEELVAIPSRHSSKEKAELFFLDGMTQAMHRLVEQVHPAFPVTIYYAFKQSESNAKDGTASTGWETFLDAVICSGFAITGTWPVRTENESRMRGQTSNALASSIVLVCRPRPDDLPAATRRDFLNSLKAELPDALAKLQASNIAPVDLAQAAIGPGMAVFTRYAKVLDADGKSLTVRTALALINQVLDEALAEQEGDFDADSRFALAWFEQHGFTEGEFGVADVLARAKGTAVEGVANAGIIVTGKGKVRILKPSELPADWDPMTDKRLTVWEMVHQLIRVLESTGESAAAELAVKLGSRAETARELCYRLYTVCERKKRPTDAMAYNALVQSWPEISRLAQEAATRVPQQSEFALEM